MAIRMVGAGLPAAQPASAPEAAVSSPRLPLTDEQAAICSSKADVVKVSAFAGTGKTTTLVALAEANPRQRILYLAFNKSIQAEAQRKFPANVTARTSHSIAFSAFGRRYSGKLANDIRPFHVVPHLSSSLRDIPPAAHNLYGARVIETIKNHLSSAGAEMSDENVSVGASPVEIKHFGRGTILADARRVWQSMCDPAGDVPMLHDGYLKLFQTSGKPLPFDLILFDEAQDTNPVTQAIVEGQSARKVYVGDRHQAIYGFRGASNAMESIRAGEHHYLTGSFRFGPAVAAVANSILAVKGEGVRLNGYGAASRLRRIGASEPHAFISRGNCALFRRAVAAVEGGESFAFVGDVKGYRFDQILDVHTLASGGVARDPFLRSFATVDDLAEYGEAVNDREILSCVKVAQKYTDRLPVLIEMIESGAVAPEQAQVVLTTAHKSKGLEFPSVRLAEDFMPLLDEDGKVFQAFGASPAEIEDVNVQYVAATRAMRALQLNDSLSAYLQQCGEPASDLSRARP